MDRQAFFHFLDKSALDLPKKFFQSERERDSDKKRIWELRRMKLSGNLALLKQNKVAEFPQNDKIIKIYEAVVYKYGRAYRHHNFYRSAKQLLSFLKRLRDGSFLKQLERLFKGLNEAGCAYLPTQEFIIYLGALLCRRIALLDRLRWLAARNVDFDLGYVQLGHLVKFNMLLISLASELAENALRHLELLLKVYNETAECFCSASDKFPVSCECFPLDSVKVNSCGQLIISELTPENVKCLCDIVDHKVPGNSASQESSLEISLNDLKEKIEKEMILLTNENAEGTKNNEEQSGFYRIIDKSRTRKRKRNKT
ncbi:unnamed protein product [Bursaphelenchus xylophilus]|uniref:(pine wood nematode) hypothetical protein n=1 Tax=Bursaphelenchus xylophilus TaxID=6326 RepID=A0A1I7SWA8_BURXY|nr:unnamed protein product [Bursaphelenchus xylophilus]CAG9099105.1 unnamed protein product [Bursaphelenchus xylophilus]